MPTFTVYFGFQD